MNKTTKYILIGLTIWIVMQITRVIAIPIVQDVLSGVDDAAYLYPAILDIVVALLSPFAVYLLWKKRTIFSWTAIIAYFVISIIDHGDSVTASLIARIPQTFQEMGITNATNTPIFQSIGDIICIILMCRKDITSLFFNNEKI